MIPIPSELPVGVLIKFLEEYAEATAKQGFVPTIENLVNEITEDELRKETNAMTQHAD